MPSGDRLALNQKDAAAALGICVDTFKAHVRPQLKAVYIAGATRYRVADLEAWLAANAH
jgi:hypothetical protein